MRSLLCVLLFAAIHSPSLAQSASDFKPSPYLDTIPSGISQLIHSRYQSEIARINSEKGKHRSEVKARYKLMLDRTLDDFNDDRLMINSEVSDYLSTIAGKLALANNIDPKDVSIFGFRSEVPNAMCYGNGILSVMLGLLARLESEDQVAFVVAHEMGHLLARDNVRGIEDAVAMLYDKNLRKQINSAQRSSFNSYTKQLEILSDIELNYSSHSRAHEAAADSSAVLLYLKAGYSVSSIQRTMEILGKADQDTYDSLDLSSWMTSNGIKSDPVWLRYAPSARWHKDNRLPDSLKTHPNMTNRTIAVSRQLSNLGYHFEDLNEEGHEIRTNVYRTRAQFEMVDAELQFKNLGRALYHSIQLQKKYPGNAWLSAMTGRCLYEIFVRQKTHTLGLALPQPSPSFSDSYNRLLAFVHALRLGELEYVAYQYMVSQPAAYFSNDDFLYSMWLTSHLKISKLDPEKLKSDYLEMFPEGRYKSLIK